MRYLIFSVMLTSLVSYANPECKTDLGEEEVKGQYNIDTKVPSHLKGAMIIVRRADGKESAVPAELFKVVPRKQQFITSKTQQLVKTSCEIKNLNRNRISVLGGAGPTGSVSKSTSGLTTTVDLDKGAIAGAQYQRLVTDELSVGVQVQSNKSGAVTIGIDF